ncbi:hypothetical protein NECID01_0007 [Nematocida sp. AWRm77]|nr:hypothetical protein NECID01_0007 [Nematocida sp. AWRm77]
MNQHNHGNIDIPEGFQVTFESFKTVIKKSIEQISQGLEQQHKLTTQESDDNIFKASVSTLADTDTFHKEPSTSTVRNTDNTDNTNNTRNKSNTSTEEELEEETSRYLETLGTESTHTDSSVTLWACLQQIKTETPDAFKNKLSEKTTKSMRELLTLPESTLLFWKHLDTTRELDGAVYRLSLNASRGDAEASQELVFRSLRQKVLQHYEEYANEVEMQTLLRAYEKNPNAKQVIQNIAVLLEELCASMAAKKSVLKQLSKLPRNDTNEFETAFAYYTETLTVDLLDITRKLRSHHAFGEEESPSLSEYTKKKLDILGKNFESYQAYLKAFRRTHPSLGPCTVHTPNLHVTKLRKAFASFFNTKTVPVEPVTESAAEESPDDIITVHPTSLPTIEPWKPKPRSHLPRKTRQVNDLTEQDQENKKAAYRDVDVSAIEKEVISEFKTLVFNCVVVFCFLMFVFSHQVRELVCDRSGNLESFIFNITGIDYDIFWGG